MSNKCREFVNVKSARLLIIYAIYLALYSLQKCRGFILCTKVSGLCIVYINAGALHYGQKCQVFVLCTQMSGL